MMEKFIGDNKTVFHQPFCAKQIAIGDKNLTQNKEFCFTNRVIPKAMKTLSLRSLCQMLFI